MKTIQLFFLIFNFFFIYANYLYSFDIHFIDIPNKSKIKTGYINLKWDTNITKAKDMTIMYELEKSTKPTFKIPSQIYMGYDKGTFISGLPEGTHYFRVRAVKDKTEILTGWSKPIQVDVEYQSKTLTISLMISGGVIFLAIVLVVLVGNHLKRKEEGEDT